VRILRGFLKGVHLSRITGSQIPPVRNATNLRACCGNDAPRAENGDADCKVLALPSELGNPHSFVNERQQKRHFGIAARALTNTLQSGSIQTNKSLDGLPGYSTAGRNSTFFAAIVTCVLFSMGRG
jgi:hypothetical protein